MIKTSDLKKELKSEMSGILRNYNYSPMRGDVDFFSKFGKDTSYFSIQISSHPSGHNIFSWVSFRYDDIENLIIQLNGGSITDGRNRPTLHAEMHDIVGRDINIYSISEFSEIKSCAARILEFFIESAIPFIKHISNMKYAFSLIMNGNRRNIIAGAGSMKAIRITTIAHMIGEINYRDIIINEYMDKFKKYNSRALSEYEVFINKLLNMDNKLPIM
ncbi:hypothetical protein ACRC7T_15660 [Segnochrobactraceae bacterium EtOH-i3]